MPPCGMSRILWMIEHCHTDRLAFNWSVVVTPVGAFAPGFVIALARAVDNVPFTSFEPHCLSNPDSHHPVLIVAENDVTIRGMDRDLKIEHSSIIAIRSEDPERAFVSANQRA